MNGHAASVPRPPLASRRLTKDIVQVLLAWFVSHARDLPWRRTLDPYAIWISEVMLQQTQVKTVIPYWERWMRRLPDIHALARARPETVLKLWEGLGYYTRARNLQRAARLIVRDYDGWFPEGFEQMLELPGVGRYTAGAVASIAFDQPAPILDGNVIRVLTRLHGIAGDPRRPATNDRLWQLAERLVQRASTMAQPRVNPGSLPAAGSCSLLNQSLMELGALICTPRQPRCNDCPVRRHCIARRKNCAESLPATGPRPAPVARSVVAFAVEHRQQFLVRQRPAGVVNAHLWEFPNCEVVEPRPNLTATARKLCGVTSTSMTPLLTFRHSITRSRISLRAFHIAIQRRPAGGGQWLTRRDLERLPFTSAHRRIVHRLLASRA